MNGLYWKDSLLTLELNIVQDLMVKQTKSKDQRFDQVVEDWLSQRGKMLRPAFYLLSSRFGIEEAEIARMQHLAAQDPETLEKELLSNPKQMRFYKGAAAIELIHMASLIHDDIIDEAKLRRGRPSIQSAYGKDYAVYMGDFFFCKAVLMVADHEEKDGLRSMADAMAQICIGEIKQYHSRHILKPDLRNYFKIIASKTAALFALSFYAGAIENNCGKKMASDLGKVGYNMGMAFQIVDDLLDYRDDHKIGKETYKDLSQGNINLPIHLALKTQKAGALTALLESEDLGLDTFMSVVQIVHQTHADQSAAQYAHKYTKRAIRYLNRLPDHPTKWILKEQISDLLERQM